MSSASRVSHAGRPRWARRLFDPAVLKIVAAVFLVSAAGQALVQAYLHEESVAVVAGFSVAGSLTLAAAIVIAALRSERTSRTAGPPAAISATVPGIGRQDVTSTREMIKMPPHCDSLDGPVVAAARHALATEDVDVVLPYVPADAETEIREAFTRVLPLHIADDPAADVGRQWFFETVVRVHRAGEHAAFTGLKPAGLDVGPVIPLAEKATETGDVEEVYRLLTAELHTELTHRLDKVTSLAADKDTSVPAARAHVQAMLGFQVYTNHVRQALHADPHGEHGHE